MNCELTGIPENQINPPDSKVSDEVYTSRIESQLKEYIDADDDLYIAIAENDEVLDCLYTMYRAYVNDDERGTNMAASAFLLSMDSVLIERATRNV